MLDDTPFSAVLFDLDGTLLDSLSLILASYRYTLEAHGLPARSDAEVLEGLGTTLESQLARWTDDPAQAAAMVDTYITHNLRVHDELVRPYPGVSELVRELHTQGTPLALVTSKRRRGAERGLAALGLSDCFAALVCGDEVTRAKPDPEPVRRALSLLGDPLPARVAFVGDAIHDIESGKGASVFTVAVSWGAGTPDSLRAGAPDLWADDAAQLRRALRMSET